MKRKKRLKKGVESLKKQIEIHEEKLEEAIEKGDEELAQYYEREIVDLMKEESKKKKQLERK